MRRVLVVAGVFGALGLARLLPESGLLVLPRLAAALALLLLPGLLLADLLGRRSASATVVWTLAATAAAWLVTFAVDGGVDTALLVLAAVAAVALAASAARGTTFPAPGRAAAAVFGAGALFGLALWRVSGPIVGDGLFHLARVRKLVELGDLDLVTLNEFADGDLHAGYAFPLWHGALALLARLAGVDVETAFAHAPSVLAPVAFLVAFEAGRALFGTAWMGVAALAAQVGQIALAAGHGGAYASLSLPGTATRQLVVPAVLTLLFSHLRAPSPALLAAIAAGALAATLMHVTYALFLAVPLAAFLAVRALADRREALRVGAALTAFALGSAAVVAWLLPLADETVSRTPDAIERARAIARYGAQLDVSGGDYRLAPEVVSRGGAVAVAALALVPLAALAVRRRWGALVVGGALSVLALVLVPALFTALSESVSLSQSRRAAGFVPFAFAFAGGMAVLAGTLRWALAPIALAAGIALQRAYPGDFSQRFLEGGGPAAVVWWAAGATVVGTLVALILRPRVVEHRGPIAATAALAFVLPVAVAAAGDWSPSPRRTPSPLTPGLVRALRERVPARSVVFSDLGTSYRIAAAAPVYIAVAPPAHVADTDDNRPYRRRDDAILFGRTGDLAIPRRYGADYLLLDRRHMRLQPAATLVYEDGRYALYRLF